MENYLYVAAAFLISLGLCPIVILFCRKKKLFDPLSPRKIHKDPTPRLGSLSFVPVFLALSLVYLALNDRPLFMKILPVAASGFGIFVFGLCDDFFNLSALTKLLGQAVLCLLPLFFGFRIEQIGTLQLHDFGLPLTFFWFIGMVNAYNLIDGLDGLSSSISIVILLTYGFALMMMGRTVFCIVPFILCASLLGFFWWNKPKAKIFMGDGGSQFLGFIIAVLMLCDRTPKMLFNQLPFMFALSSIPLFDTLAAIWRRKRMGESFFTPDKMHLHHKLLRMGFSNISILFFILSLQIAICSAGLLAYTVLGQRSGLLVLLFTIFVALIFFTIIHYTYHALVKKIGISSFTENKPSTLLTEPERGSENKTK
jgi:UDP-GlcNAc:undecaprenyl-phosphate GlcNAc-1-phosphate transferase